MLANVAGKNFIIKDAKMARINLTWILYGKGLISPLLIVLMIKLLERFGIKATLGIGWILLVGYAICFAGLFLQSAGFKLRLVLALAAVIVIPLQLLVLGVLFLAKGGLTGTQ